MKFTGIKCIVYSMPNLCFLCLSLCKIELKTECEMGELSSQ